MKIITWNINGYRSADKLGNIDELISKNKPDIICLQEIKMNNEVINNYDYNCYYNFALKKGYSGTMVFSKEKPINIITEIGFKRFDEEGRFLLLEYNNLIVINLYIPHGGRQKENHKYKFATINKVLNLINGLNKEVIICTDFNIAHNELDVARYKYNYENNMFTSNERAKIDKLLSMGFLDSFRVKVKEGNIYSMWPNGFNARERNLGWRIDYIFISKKFENNIKNVEYLKEQYGSDHCPFMLELDV
jgi:exodeoxyribonuclease-3